MYDYSFANLSERAQRALEAHQQYVEKLEAAYKSRQLLRQQRGIPTVGILGMGRAGKDTAGEFLVPRYSLGESKTSSLVVLPLVAHMASQRDSASYDAFYKDRHNHRRFWIEACHALREDDKTRLVRWCLSTCDLAMGYRGKIEFDAANAIVDLTVWIENPRVGNDITVEFMREDCDVVIDNATTLERFHERLARFGQSVYFRR